MGEAVVVGSAVVMQPKGCGVDSSRVGYMLLPGSLLLSVGRLY